jgi:Mrp family chromosome partitioning ATPase
MDQVLLVVEGEKTLRPDVKRAHSLLTKYGAKVTGIYNKEKNGGPAWLAES